MVLDRIKKIGGYVDKLSTGVGAISFFCIAALVIMNVVDVFLSQLFNVRILGAVELSQRLLMCSVFAAFAYAQSKKSHITMTLIVAKLPRVPRFIIFTLMSVLSLGTIVLMTYAAWAQTVISFESAYVTEVLKVPLWPFFVVETVSMAIFAVATLYDTIVYAIAIFRQDVAEHVQKDWT